MWRLRFVGHPSTPASRVLSPPTGIENPLCSRGPWWMTVPASVNYDSLRLENHEHSIGTILTSTHRRTGSSPHHSRRSFGTVCPHDEPYFAYEAGWWKAGLWGRAKSQQTNEYWKANNTILPKNMYIALHRFYRTLSERNEESWTDCRSPPST